MDGMSSVEFRKRYAKLMSPVEVTVNGHVIGTWIPGYRRWAEGEAERLQTGYQRDMAAGRLHMPDPGSVRATVFPGAEGDRIVSPRPFTPAPKPGKR